MCSMLFNRGVCSKVTVEGDQTSVYVEYLARAAKEQYDRCGGSMNASQVVFGPTGNKELSRKDQSELFLNKYNSCYSWQSDE